MFNKNKRLSLVVGVSKFSLKTTNAVSNLFDAI
jgi:hypothetical protein